MSAQSVFLNSYSDVPSLIASNIEPWFAPTMYKDNTKAFKAGDLLARDAGGNVEPFTWTTEAADKKFAGFCAYDVAEDADEVRVIVQGAIRVSPLNFAGVTESDGTTVSNFTLAKFLALTTVGASVYDEFAFQGQAVMKLSAVDGQYSS